MKWTEYREKLTENLKVTSSIQQIQFAIEICEKLLPDYDTFEKEFKWGDLNSLINGLVLCKENANGLDTNVKIIENQISEIVKNTPDTEDFGEVSGSLALNSAAAISEALSFILDNKTERISDIGSLSYDSAYFKACENYPKLSESEIENHQDLQNEIKWQLEKIKYVA